MTEYLQFRNFYLRVRLAYFSYMLRNLDVPGYGNFGIFLNRIIHCSKNVIIRPQL